MSRLNAPVHPVPDEAGDSESRIQGGAYVVVFLLTTDAEIGVGKLGLHRFVAGSWAYAGSALGGLDARVGRHLEGGRVRHWHVDYLREHAVAVSAWVVPGTARRECELTAALIALPGAAAGPSGFGSSDCRCRAHLVRLPAGLDLGGVLGLAPYFPSRSPRVPLG